MLCIENTSTDAVYLSFKALHSRTWLFFSFPFFFLASQSNQTFCFFFFLFSFYEQLRKIQDRPIKSRLKENMFLLPFLSSLPLYRFALFSCYCAPPFSWPFITYMYYYIYISTILRSATDDRVGCSPTSASAIPSRITTLTNFEILQRTSLENIFRDSFCSTPGT